MSKSATSKWVGNVPRGSGGAGHTVLGDIPPQSQTPDYPELRNQINDFEHTFYGPHACDACGDQIVKMAVEQGGHAYDLPLPPNGGKYKPHVCQARLKDPLQGYSHFDSINYSVRHLAGKILTIVDATAGDRQQRKATKDLVKEAFKHTLDQIHSGCYSMALVGGCASTVEPLQALD